MVKQSDFAYVMVIREQAVIIWIYLLLPWENF